MDEIPQRLAKCFTAVFPHLRELETYSASVASVASWDSTAAIMLANVIEEEFNISVDYERLPDLLSFDLIVHYLREHNNSSA
jgi:acyl carrier protein